MHEMKIYHPEVLTNLSHFRKHVETNPPTLQGAHGRAYPCFLDCKTGLIHFIGRDHPQKSHLKVEKEIQIIVREEPDQKPHFEIEGDTSAGVSILIQKVAWETIRALNFLALLIRT